MLREIPNVLTKKECESIINYSRPNLKKSMVVDEDNIGGEVTHSSRTNSQAIFKPMSELSNLSKLKDKIRNIISEETGFPIENQESLTTLHYNVGEKFEPHYDWFYKDNKYWEGIEKCGGQRIVSILIYLNDVSEGGETCYPELGIEIKPEMGKLLIHQNVLEGRELKSALHGGKPPISGDKWALVCWVRENKWRAVKDVF